MLVGEEFVETENPIRKGGNNMQEGLAQNAQQEQPVDLSDAENKK